MSTGYEPNIEGALAVLVDLMQGSGFTMTRSPYAPNYRGLVDAFSVSVTPATLSGNRTLTAPDETGTIATQDFATAIAIALG